VGLVVVLVLLALAFAALGLVVTALKWLLIIAVAFFVIGVVMGWSRRGG
jgi:hypothetical protein